MIKDKQLFEGKAKTIYSTNDADHLIMCFRDDTSAFNGLKIEQLARKGRVNNQFNAFIMELLNSAGIRTHFVRLVSENESLVRNLQMIPLESVVRNRVAGSLGKRLGLKEGDELTPPVFEFFLKDDALNDPMVNESHIHTFGWASAEEVQKMKALTLEINEILTRRFAQADLILVDYKLEFGRCDDDLMLGDEFSPDGCRLWDANTLEKMDKDRFRQSLGDVIEHYEMVGARLGINFQ